ncbi:hypothetical protein ACFOU0_13680 [Salinicoccus sesuvii]|uniref:Uncharacterized protein n=1 Tax=Salinicoccus sesuvii TaxID=868281 RepID=A0ABV7N6S9_9STAP
MIKMMKRRALSYVLVGGLAGGLLEGVMTGILAGAVTYIAVRYEEVTNDK